MKRFCILRKKVIFKDITNLVCRKEEDRFKEIYYVDGNILKREFKDRNVYTVYLYGNDIRQNFVDDDVDKTICYIFDNIIFEKGINVVIFFNVKVIFRNCIFNDFIKLLGVNDVVFENNKYFDHDIFYDGSRFFLWGYGKSLSFINDYFINREFRCLPNRFGIGIEFDKLDIINTKIELCNKLKDDNLYIPDTFNMGDVSIKVRDFKILNSSLKVGSVYLKYGTFVYIDSEFQVRKKLIIENNRDNLEIFNILSPHIIYNGNVLCDDDNFQWRIKQLEVIREFLNYISSFDERSKLLECKKSMSKILIK